MYFPMKLQTHIANNAVISKIEDSSYFGVPCKVWKLECAASNGNRYPPYPQVMATAISQ